MTMEKAHTRGGMGPRECDIASVSRLPLPLGKGEVAQRLWLREMAAIARELMASPEPTPTHSDLLEAWAEGFMAGHDMASGDVTTAVHRERLRLAEQVTDIRDLVDVARFSRQRRIARELAAMEALAPGPMSQTDDWPRVTMPGTGVDRG